MQGKYKQFDKALYKKHDDAAKEKTKEFLESIGCVVTEPENRYVQDLVATKDGKTFRVECEIKNNWNQPKFPFPTIQLPERKKKFFKEQTVFFIWSKALDDAIFFWSDHVKSLTPVEVKNKFIPEGELFFQIPLSKTKQVSKL